MCQVMGVYMIYIHLDPEIYIKVQVLTDQTLLTNTNTFFLRVSILMVQIQVTPTIHRRPKKAL